MTRQRITRPVVAVLAAGTLAVLGGCAQDVAKGPEHTPDGESTEARPARAAGQQPLAKLPDLKPPLPQSPDLKTPRPKSPDLLLPLPESPTKPAPSARAPAPPGRTLADILQYVGAFRVPRGKIGDSTFEYGGTALAFNPTNNSLFLVGHDWDQAIAEVKIPDSVVNSSRLGDLPTATALQPFVKVLPRIPNFTLKGKVKVGGLLVVGNQLIGTAYVYYDGAKEAVESHFRLNSLDLASAKVEGLFRVGTLGGGFVGGYMATVPTEWQQALGTRYVTGQAALCIIGRTSAGPAAFGFDPRDLGRDAAPVTPLVYYPVEHPLGPMRGRDPNFNGATLINGVFFPPGSRSVLFFGSHGTGEVGYGEAADFNDKVRRYRGYHSRDSKYEYQVWAYDALDLVAVKEQKKQPWEIRPYGVWQLRFPIADGVKCIGGVAFDPAANRLYVAQMGGEESNRGHYVNQPLIHVFKLSVGGK
jgi:hypothetical protein